MKPFFEALFGRFHELHTEIEQALDALPDEALDWTPGAGMNTVNVLVTHLTGAERFLIGDVVMGEPSNRIREAEFQAHGLTRQDLLHRVAETESYIQGAFEKMSLADLETERMNPRHGKMVGTAWAILHPLEHTAIHLGHIQVAVQLWQQRIAG
jgi:hypothetical protein